MTTALPAILLIRGKPQPPSAAFRYQPLHYGRYICPFHQRPMKPGGYVTRNGITRVKFECGCRVSGPVKE